MQHESGMLVRDPGAENFDFQYLESMKIPYQGLQPPEIKLQSRFIWSGPAGTEITTDQHAIVAYTQKLTTDSLVNAEGQHLWSHGAGAVVGEYGLGLELWFIQNGQHNGIIWNQHTGQCAADVLGTLPAGSMCLPASVTAPSYMTVAPDFTLRYGVPYWVRVKISTVGTSPGMASLYADLIEEKPTGPVIMQQAQINFVIATMLPNTLYPVEAVVARTPGSTSEPVIYFNAFNYGF